MATNDFPSIELIKEFEAVADPVYCPTGQDLSQSVRRGGPDDRIEGPLLFLSCAVSKHVGGRRSNIITVPFVVGMHRLNLLTIVSQKLIILEMRLSVALCLS